MTLEFRKQPAEFCKQTILFHKTDYRISETDSPLFSMSSLAPFTFTLHPLIIRVKVVKGSPTFSLTQDETSFHPPDKTALSKQKKESLRLQALLLM